MVFCAENIKKNEENNFDAYIYIYKYIYIYIFSYIYVYI